MESFFASISYGVRRFWWRIGVVLAVAVAVAGGARRRRLIEEEEEGRVREVYGDGGQTGFSLQLSCKSLIRHPCEYYI